MSWTLVIDAALVALLTAVAVGLVILHRRLSRMRAEQRRFTELVDRLEAAGRQTRSALASFREQAQTLADLEERLERAQALRQELVMITETGEALADRLAALAESARRAAQDSRPEAAGLSPVQEGVEATAAAGRAVLKTLRSLR